VPAFIRCQFLIALQLLLLTVALFAGSFSAQAQDADSSDRLYKHSKVEVEEALQALKAYATNRLPVLDGFVNANATTLAKLENPHYQLRIEVESQGSNQTLVSVIAKITAWSMEDDPSRSQYVVVPSNGRLEQDILDRLSVYLEKAALPQPASAATAESPAAPEPTLSPAGGSPSTAGAAAASHSPPPETSHVQPSGAVSRHNPTDPAALASEISAMQAQRKASESNQRKLQQQISELQANASSQKFVSNLAVIKAPQTPVFQQDDDTSKVLFRADPEDEFEIIAIKDIWFHVRLENGGDGWIRGSQLQPPKEVDDTEDAAIAVNFTTPNEEIKPFAGDWAPLKGKPALFVFAQPTRTIPVAILGQTQFQFVKHVFTLGYREAAHTQQSMAGVVVVFLGDKGGVAAATLTDIHRWRDGTITDKVFLERCSFDPPEAFRDASSPTSVRKTSVSR